jgi:hypothetical protein
MKRLKAWAVRARANQERRLTAAMLRHNAPLRNSYLTTIQERNAAIAELATLRQRLASTEAAFDLMNRSFESLHASAQQLIALRDETMRLLRFFDSENTRAPGVIQIVVPDSEVRSRMQLRWMAFVRAANGLPPFDGAEQLSPSRRTH